MMGGEFTSLGLLFANAWALLLGGTIPRAHARADSTMGAYAEGQ